MNYRQNNQWAAEFEAVRRQRRETRHRHGVEGFGPMGGPPPWVAQMFGPQWGGQGGGRGGRRPRVRRGDVRSAILDVLGASAEPLNGYQVIQQIADRSEGAWKPSPGSVYPTLSQLVDEGLVEDAPHGRKTLRLTETGTAYVAENAEQIAAVWAVFTEEPADEDAVDLQLVIKQTVGAIVQVATAGTPAQQAKAVDILAETRRQLYGLLAAGPEAAERD